MQYIIQIIIVQLIESRSVLIQGNKIQGGKKYYVKNGFGRELYP